jgi:hypothetical protein
LAFKLDCTAFAQCHACSSWGAGCGCDLRQMSSAAEQIAGASPTTRRGAVNKKPDDAPAMELDTGLSQGVTGMHLLPPGLANPPYSTGLPAGFEARHVPVGGASDSDDGSQRSLVYTGPLPDIFGNAMDTAEREVSTLWLPVAFTHNLIETAVLQHFELIQAAASINSDSIGLIPKHGLSGWLQLLRALAGLAYAPSAEDSWHRLGIAPLSGTAPTEAMIEQRFAVAAMLLSAAHGPSWPQAEKAAAAQALDQMEQARASCIDLLKGVLRERARDPRNACPQWSELGSEARAVILCSAPVEGEVVATQLSNILGIADDIVCPDRVLPPEGARSFVSRLALDGARTLAAVEAPGIVCWAPTDASALARLLTAYVQHAAMASKPCSLRLLVPLDTIPGSASATDLIDLWSHPLLADKWRAIVRNIEFTSQPMEVVLPGKVGPTTSPKTLMFATISASTAYAPPSIRSVALPLFELGRGKCLRVDCLTTDMMEVRRALHKVLAGTPTRWADPLRSPGSTTTAARTIIGCHFAPGAVTALELRMLISCLRNLHVPATTLLAAEDIFADNAAMLLDVSDPTAAMEAVALCDDMAFVSAKLLTVRSLTAPAVWEDRLEQLFAETPARCITRIRWRKSRNGGRTIAQPAATARQVQATIRVEKVCPVAAALSIQAEVALHGNLGHDVRQVELQILRVLAGCGVVLQERAESAPVAPDSWQSIASDMSAGPSGRLRLCLSSPGQMALVRQALHDKAFQIGVDMITLVVHDDASLAQQAKNGRRGARRRAGPPNVPAV